MGSDGGRVGGYQHPQVRKTLGIQGNILTILLIKLKHVSSSLADSTDFGQILDPQCYSG